jgi:hypothetical protein
MGRFDHRCPGARNPVGSGPNTITAGECRRVSKPVPHCSKHQNYCIPHDTAFMKYSSCPSCIGAKEAKKYIYLPQSLSHTLLQANKCVLGVKESEMRMMTMTTALTTKIKSRKPTISIKAMQKEEKVILRKAKAARKTIVVITVVW